ncbi:Planctomycete cytochrome C [Gimesia panareensis]|uniref:Planctomycete cytochrome C n=1 Tax=Gimesia panareensis TaxID=2527978 RepID=A0A518FXF8_9PLAN|nr:DUF1553 domain-containing protein [Gimesia panareensis]QDV20991.1 Planctomycete cytochrome C [Gimesia panareensis]
MLSRASALVFLISLCLTAIAKEPQESAKQNIDFEKQVLPLLQAKCFDCHNADTQESKFRLDRKAALLRGGDSGEPAIISGNSAQSHLIKLVRGEEAGLLMPPDESERLSPEQIQLLADWIDQGAPWPGPNGVVKQVKQTTDHWSFQPLAKVTPPEIKDTWVRNGIDAFILEKLQQKQLTHNPRADRRTLIRRLYLDLLGIPPTPAEVERFVKDDAPDAWQKLVSATLDNPHYGERWARYWLDLVRFAETHGFETNRERPHAWPYRDYVIQALNSDKPYDQFVKEQIAGDSFGNPAGTAYLVAGPYDQVKSPDINLTLMQRQNELDDMINTTGTVFLGLTLGCARCHNHKFDPITQTDYYSMQAIFAGVQHGDRRLPVPSSREKEIRQKQTRIAELKSELEQYRKRPESRRFVSIDDQLPPTEAASQLEVLQPRAGYGANPGGTERGAQNDPGSATRSPNLSGGKYSWWKNQPGKPLVAWKPDLAGDYRLWLSWGCGFETHSSDARYVLDRDGDPATTDDWQEIAQVDQKRFADGTKPERRAALWSGFYQAGVVSLEPQNALLLVGGANGTAVTADRVIWEAVSPSQSDQSLAKPGFRKSVQATHNVERFSPVATRFVRFTIHATNQSAPCLDELEIFSGGQNVALASAGSKATCSSALPGHPIHKLEHINDGKYGNSHSWISHENGGGWIQIELPQTTTIDRIEWARDREGKYSDRLPVDYVIEVSNTGQDWQTIAGSSDRLPLSLPANMLKAANAAYRFDDLPPKQARVGKQLLADLKREQSALESLQKTDTVYAGQFKQPGPTHRLYRGEPLAKREQVSPNAPAIFTDLDLKTSAPEKERRTLLAEWIASSENPLTARVIVNRLWQFHFGKGLVTTPSDFGAGGVPPTHPELLDWLAQELIAHNWSLKHVHRLILTSATYQQSGQPNPQALKVDAASQLWWRFPPRRLEAEPIRDSILAITGVLDPQMGGPGFSAFEVEAENVRHYHPKKTYGPEDWRRMIYMTKVRMEQDSVFGLFDCPDAATSVAKRSRSTTPLQALNLFNSRFLLQQADLFAQRLEREHPGDLGAQVKRAFELCYSRPPTETELAESVQFIKAEQLPAFCRALLNSNELLFIQ